MVVSDILCQRSLRIARGGGIALMASCSLAAPALALDCPDPQNLASPGVLQETPAQIEATARILSAGDLEKKTWAVIADLRQRYPKAENAELANYLVTAYCPVINAAPLSETEKKARMDEFVKQLMDKVY